MAELLLGHTTPGVALGCLSRAIAAAQAALTTASDKARYWEKLRDIQQLLERGVHVRNSAGGRSTSYSLAPL